MFWQRKSTINQVSVSMPNEDCFVWQVDTTNVDFGRGVTVNVDVGCEAICYINGGNKVVFHETGELNLRPRDRANAKILIIGVNADKRIKVPFGISEIPFKDKIKPDQILTPLVGMHGSYECCVNNGDLLYRKVARKDPMVCTSKDIWAHIETSYKSLLVSEFVKILRGYDYYDVNGALGKLSESLMSLLGDKFLEIGLRLDLCAIDPPIYFGPNYNESRQEVIDGNKTAQQVQAIIATEGATIIDIINATNKKTETSTTCANCNHVNRSDAKFCEKCGRRLNK